MTNNKNSCYVYSESSQLAELLPSLHLLYSPRLRAPLAIV